jgi:hypothetical protein
MRMDWMKKASVKRDAHAAIKRDRHAGRRVLLVRAPASSTGIASDFIRNSLDRSAVRKAAREKMSVAGGATCTVGNDRIAVERRSHEA